MLDQFILDHSIFYMERSKETSGFRQGIEAMRPLCGKKHGGNRKERLRNYASFPDWGEAPSFPFAYRLLVASPPRRWRSALFLAITAATSLCSGADNAANRDSMSLCTVDLDTPSTLAVFLTVAPVAAIYSASRSTLRSIA